ncbi:ABC transporter substrate-binding protein [Streptomyces sp. NPDC004539]|uniref:ABC transporter substrate-binding protein n=1 Tax=Streptomyces sp. NPDC004539 TaxID=3154280 RepID=UPI0033A8A716
MPSRTRPRGARAVALAAAAGLSLLTACSTSNTGNTSASGGTLKIAIDSDPVCLDPVQATLIASSVIGRQLVDSLIDQDPETGEFVPWLADKWQASPDAKTFTFHLRAGATFADGTPIDSAAVKANFDAVVKAGAKSAFGAQYLLGYTGTTVKDAQNFTVTFGQPNAQFLMAASTPTLGLLSPASVKTSLADRCTGKGLIGSGPFTFTEYRKSASITLTRRTGYDWPSKLATHTGQAHLEKVTYNVVTEASVRSGSLKSGQVDVATTLLPEDEQTLNGNGFHILARVNPGVVIGASPNLKHSTILRDATVREAIQLAVDRKEIADSVLSPSYGVAGSVLSTTTPGYSDLTAALKTDPEQAKSLLEKAGWKAGPDGIREKDGKKLTLSLLFFYQANVQEAVQQQLRKVGIDLRLKQVTPAEFQALSPKGDYDLRASSTSRPDPDILRSIFSPKAGNAAWLSDTDPQVPQLEQLYTGIRQTTDTTKRAELAAQAQKLLVEQNYDFPFSQVTQVIGAADRVTGLRYDAASRFVLYDTALGR